MGYLILFGWIACGFIASAIADRKNMGTGLWFVLGLIFGPFAVLMIAASSSYPTDEKLLHVKGIKRCPFCAEEIKAEAIVCKHCGRDVPKDGLEA